MTAARLQLVDSQTGEVVEDERDDYIAQLERDLKGKTLTIGRLNRELRELRAVEPESEVILDILRYWRERCRPRAEIAPGGKRWEKVRARLRDNLKDRDPWTPAELKLAVDGALLDPWLSGRDRNSKGYLDAETVFRDAEMVERLRDKALGFKAQTGVEFSTLLDCVKEMRIVDWGFLLRPCECGHRRLEHSRADPNRDGREVCFFCECEDFDLDEIRWNRGKQSVRNAEPRS